MNPWPQQKRLSVGDLIPNDRKRSFLQMNGHGHDPFRHSRKKRSAFTAKQKDGMVNFWQTSNWQAIYEEEEMEAAAKKIDVNVAQLKVFRQNNRKKYAHPSKNDDENEENDENDESNDNRKKMDVDQGEEAEAEQSD